MMMCMQPSPSFYWAHSLVVRNSYILEKTNQYVTYNDIIFAESVVVGLLRIIQKGAVTLNHKNREGTTIPRTHSSHHSLLISCVFIVVISVSHPYDIVCMYIPDM